MTKAESESDGKCTREQSNSKREGVGIKLSKSKNKIKSSSLQIRVGAQAIAEFKFVGWLAQMSTDLKPLNGEKATQATTKYTKNNQRLRFFSVGAYKKACSFAQQIYGNGAKKPTQAATKYTTNNQQLC